MQSLQLIFVISYNVVIVNNRLVNDSLKLSMSNVVYFPLCFTGVNLTFGMWC